MVVSSVGSVTSLDVSRDVSKVSSNELSSNEVCKLSSSSSKLSIGSCKTSSLGSHVVCGKSGTYSTESIDASLEIGAKNNT